MNLHVLLYSASIPLWILTILGFMVAFSLTLLTVPSIVTITKLKNLCDSPNCRTSHIGSIPTLGGIAVFFALILSTVLFTGTLFLSELKYIISGLVIVFFVGIKDDILVIDHSLGPMIIESGNLRALASSVFL